MTKKQLLSPRYKVIADYPSLGSVAVVGSIKYGEEITDRGKSFKMSAYPHIFRLMDWFEERITEELPHFLIANTPNGYIKNGGVFKVAHYSEDHVRLEDGKAGYLGHFIPATEEDYNYYINKQNGTNDSI